MTDRSDVMRDYIAALDTGAARAEGDVPQAVFDVMRTFVPLINVDLLIRDEDERTLLVWRDDAYGRGWHVPGGIIRYRESVANRIAEVARTELGASVLPEADPCDIKQFIQSDRAHFISLLFRCTLVDGPEVAPIVGTARHPGQVAWIDGVPTDLYPAHEAYRSWLDGSGRSLERPGSPG